MANNVVLGDLAKYNGDDCLRFDGSASATIPIINIGGSDYYYEVGFTTSDLDGSVRAVLSNRALGGTRTVHVETNSTQYSVKLVTTAGVYGKSLSVSSESLLIRVDVTASTKSIKISENGVVVSDENYSGDILPSTDNIKIGSGLSLNPLIGQVTHVNINGITYINNGDFGSVGLLSSPSGSDGTINGATWWKQSVDEVYATPQLYKSTLVSPLTEDQMVTYTDATPIYQSADTFWNPYNQDATYSFDVASLKWITEPVDQSLTVGEELSIDAEVGGVEAGLTSSMPYVQLYGNSVLSNLTSTTVTSTNFTPIDSMQISGGVAVPHNAQISFTLGLNPLGQYNTMFFGMCTLSNPDKRTGSLFTVDFRRSSVLQGLEFVLNGVRKGYNELFNPFQNVDIVVDIVGGTSITATATQGEVVHTSTESVSLNLSDICWFVVSTVSNECYVTSLNTGFNVPTAYTLTKDSVEQDNLTTTDTTYSYSKSAELSDSSANWNLQAISGGEEINSPFEIGVASLGGFGSQYPYTHTYSYTY